MTMLHSTIAPIITSCTALRMLYAIDSTKFGAKLSRKWEMEFLNVLEGLNDEKVRYSSNQSFDDELTRAIGGDIIRFVIGFICLCTLACLFLLRFRKDKCCRIDCQRNRSMIGRFIYSYM